MRVLSKKEIKSNRLWNHWLYWMEDIPRDPDHNIIVDYDPNLYRHAFETFQARGRNALSEDEIRGIHPLIRAQVVKEITLTSLATESMEYWSKGWGWIYCWRHTLDTGGLDMLTKVAILRTMKNIENDPHSFFMRHSGISDDIKQRYLGYRISNLME